MQVGDGAVESDVSILSPCRDDGEFLLKIDELFKDGFGAADLLPGL